MNNNFIISLTTLPVRTYAINEVLKTLCNQNYENYEVHLNVPYETKFTGKFDVNFEFYQHPKLKIFWVEDVGSITKVYHTLNRVNNPEQRIISVDDDFIYHPEMLNTYDELCDLIEDGVMGFAGIYPIGIPSEGDIFCVGCFEPYEYVKVGILEGYKSICYKRKYFDEEFFTKWYKIHYNDDLCISTYLGYKTIDKLCVSYKYETNFENRMLSFPLVKSVSGGKSDVAYLRTQEGESAISYKKFYNSEFGKYIK